MARQIMRIEAKTDYARGITCNVGLIQRRHRRQRRAGRVQDRGRPARAQPAARRGDDALVPEPRADRQGRDADGRRRA